MRTTNGAAGMNDHPRILSLGAGVQSTALLLLAAQGKIEPINAAIFADTGWEPKAVYAHLNRLEREVAEPAGIPIHRVSRGNIRDDALDPSKRFASMPLHVTNRTGGKGMLRRQCTSEYKIAPIQDLIRQILGAKQKPNGRYGPVKRDQYATVLIGISLDEIQRAKDSRVLYSRHEFPLLDMRWRRDDCMNYLMEHGWGDTEKSACIGCPFHDNAEWARIAQRPDEWADACDFDNRIRAGSPRAPLQGNAYLHSQRVPLSEADLTKTSKRTVPFSCSPFSCMADQAALDFED